MRRSACRAMTCILTVMLQLPAPAWSAPDYDALDEVLVQNVRNGFVNYDGIAADPRFAAFVESLGEAATGEPDSGDAALALYINAYNTLAIRGILDGRSPETRWSRHKYFKRTKFPFIGGEITLHELEHERIIPAGDPRIHFAIVCASISCPRLASHAYRPEQLNVQLHDAAVRFINDPTRNRFDLDRRIAFLSKIFDWFAGDFARAGGTVQNYLARFVEDAAVQDALRRDEFEIRYIEYDWGLNGHMTASDPR